MAHRSRLAGFIIDCRTDDLDAATDFWAQALGCTVADREAGDAVARYQRLGDTPGGLHIEVQQVEHASRVHLDIEADDVHAEAARLEALGAKKIAFMRERWWVMEAPTGQRFCVVPMAHPERGAPPLGVSAAVGAPQPPASQRRRHRNATASTSRKTP